jgi:hypothetical protein
MRFRKSLNPNRESKREPGRDVLYDDLYWYVANKTSRKSAERERNSGNRRPSRRAARSHTAQMPTTSSTTSTRSLTRTSGLPFSGDFITNTTRPDQSLGTPIHFTSTTQIDLLAELENRPGDSQLITHNTFVPGSFTVTPESVALQLNSQNSNSTFATEATDIGVPGVDYEDLAMESKPAVYHTDPNIPPTFDDLLCGSSSDLWNAFGPQDMSPAKLNRHMEDVAREIQRWAAPPSSLGINSDQESYSARLTFANGYTSRDLVQYNDDLKYNFISQGYLNKLRTDSGKPPCFFPGPPTYQEVLTPDGILTPIRYLIFADLQWESPAIPFPSGPLWFVPYSGNGGVHDTKLILGQGWYDSTKEQAPSRT